MLNGSLPCCSKCPYNDKAHRDQCKIKSIFPNRCQKGFSKNASKKKKIVLESIDLIFQEQIVWLQFFFSSDIYLQSTYVIILINKRDMFIRLFMAWANWINCGKNCGYFYGKHQNDENKKTNSIKLIVKWMTKSIYQNHIVWILSI